ncbi:MAG: DUF5977 domain-containing protein, partial [Ginsengibacter sp.]
MITVFRSLLLILFLLEISTNAFTQSQPIDYSQQLKMPNVLPASPDAAALRKFGNIPVSYSTGVPEISIPIYTIKCATLNWPVSLSYHAAGIKVDEIASSAGLGWSLIAPGVITRSVSGLADETSSGEPVYSNSTNYYTTNPDYLIDVVNGYKDSEFDIFNFNFNGKSGKFIIKQDGGIFQIPNSDLKITYTANLSSFTITDEGGITYLFDQKERTTSQTYPVSTYTDNISAWYLSKVEMPDKNNTVQFTYGFAGYSTQLFNSSSQAIGSKYYQVPGAGVGITQVNTRSYTTNSTTTGVLKLTAISFPNGALVCSYDAAARADIGAGSNVTNKLSAITVNQVINSIPIQIKKLSLFQSYFIYHPGQGQNTPNDYRLRLDSLYEFGISTATYPQKYRFEYNAAPMVPQGNFGQDKWGFNNGQWQNPSLLQSQSVYFNSEYHNANYNIGDANRDVDTNQMKACMLTAINWPTGGKTAFTYEAHVYNDWQTALTSSEYETHVFGDQNPQVSSTTFIYPQPTVDEMPRAIVTMSKYNFAGVYDPSYVTIKDLTTGVEVYRQNQMSPTQDISSDAAIALIGGHSYELKAYVFTNISNYQLTAAIKVKWSNSLNQPDIKKGGGLRIKEIKNYTGNGKLAGTETYIYDTAVTLNTCNIINRTYSEITYRLGSIPAGFIFCSFNFSPVCRVYHSGPVYPVSTAMGSPMLYRKVQKITTDSLTGAINGKTEYSYDISFDQWDGGTGSFKMIPFISNDWKNGFLTSEANYKYSNANYSLVKKTENKYSEYKAAQLTALRIEASYVFEGCRTVSPVSEAAANDAVYHPYYYRTGSKKLTESIETLYDDNQNQIVTHTYNDYLSDKYDFATKFTVIDSKGSYDSVTFKRPSDFSAPGNVYEKMEQSNIIAPVIEQKSYNGPTLLNTVKNNYRAWYFNVIAPDSIQASVLNNPLETRLKYFAYDGYNNLLSVSKSKDAITSYIWGYNNAYPVAEAINADNNSIAYTSFETSDAGGWTGITTPGYTINGSMTGQKALTQNGFSFSKYLITAGTYIVSYWSKNGAYWVNGTTGASLRIINGWTLYEHKVAISSFQNITISGSGSIDELRLYPLGAQMKTYTYEPLIGVSSQCDINNNITYYNYDNLSRLAFIRDDNKNVLKRICYNYNGQPVECSMYGNIVKTGTFTKNSCIYPANGSAVTYTVPANTYYASLQTDADALAQNDVNANGQVYANQMGACVAPQITISCQN